jgi:hypothetical protein
MLFRPKQHGGVATDLAIVSIKPGTIGGIRAGEGCHPGCAGITAR